ncbi:adenylosuccinate lyase [Porphyromonas catoniae]|jgi:adenylosuccinate lyase|uniref:Adenylosuccinate lyase n=1 Tax=Porphyromonas catoniae F0037 TaxID=1127696 RepID=L1NIA9_9PORP|nr:adenylosuccinate lyase [Porphyromonas catoniae]EKY03000.1 adenylosuccinate lyase [Porphyromonas catoniae F0037]
MQFDSLQAISPVDGRYRAQVEALASYFSEEALIRYRVRIEVLYFIALSEELPSLRHVLGEERRERLHDLYLSFSSQDALRIKEIERTTNHDVKAVEYFLKERFDELGLSDEKEFIHFGLTSQDINNTSFPLMIREAVEHVYLPELGGLVDQLKFYADQWVHVPMLARTHGQPASPTRLGKELEVYVYRLEEQIKVLEAIPHTAKFGGATGNFNAHAVAYPDHDWKHFATEFVHSLGLKREAFTTQISNYDQLAALFDVLTRINVILIDLARDFWMYISMEYFKQQIRPGEVGSSAMPHKVNPIDFENAEGNLGLANAIFGFLARKLPISRLQRDLTDSTVLRNVGVPLAHSMIALKSLRKGLGKILLNEEALHADLDSNWAVVAEALQTILRREGYPKPYEALKALTRTNEHITEQSIHDFIETLSVSQEVKDEMRRITPHNYTGL